MFKKFLPLLLAAVAVAAHANEEKVKKAVEAALGGKVESVTKAGALGLYEVYSAGQIMYVDEKVTTLVFGALVDVKTKKNLTDERIKKLTAIKFSDLPFDQAFKQVRGDGKRVLATFEDPNCGYCKRLHKDIQKLDNATIYTFMVAFLSEDSLKKSKQIWCAPDRAKAWNDWMIDNKAPPGKDDCDTAAIDKNTQFAQAQRITGTPTLIFADGERIPGAVPLPKIEEKLNSLKGK